MAIDLTKSYSLGNVVFKNYIDLSLEEKKEILGYRNHFLVREMMHNKNEIKLNDHLGFIDKLKIDKQNSYWAVFKKNKLVSSVYLNKIDITDKTGFWGIFLNPNYIGTGIGVEIQFEAMKLFFEKFEFKTIFGEVLKINKDSIPIQLKFSFDIEDQSEKYYSMKLESEQWRNLSTETYKEFRKQILLK
ncbi:MAG: UDP-4-amino-4,6-dideoxy-N-acetyl-beta-L-altrosamine N-acetyltransferase [Polaribacter sp.]